MILFLLLFPVLGMDSLRVVSDFGEYRPLLRFHMGWDLSTQGKIGWPLVLSDSFRVVRVRDSHWGYGRAVYGVDTRGHRWVFAHLDRLHPRLEQILRQKQEATRRVAVQVNLSPPLLLRPGDTLAFSGWTGSVDPHIHVELRDPAWRPVHPAEILPYPRHPRAWIQVQGFRVVPLSPKTLIEGEPFTRIFPGVPETLHVTGPFGVWIKALVHLNGYATTPREVLLLSPHDTLFHVRMDTLDYAHQQEAAFLYAHDGRFFSDLWIRMYGFPPPPHRAYRRSTDALQTGFPATYTVVLRHPLAEARRRITVVPSSPDGDPRGHIVWDTLGMWELQAHPWGVALRHRNDQDVFWVREPITLTTPEDTLHVVRLSPQESDTFSLGSIRIVLRRNGVFRPFFAVYNAKALRPRRLPLALPLEVTVSAPQVLGRWKRDRFVPLGKVDFIPDWEIRVDTGAPRIRTCTVLPDRLRIQVEDDVAGWDPDSTTVRVNGTWRPFLSNANRGVLDLLDVRDPQGVEVLLGDGVGNRRRARCPQP